MNDKVKENAEEIAQLYMAAQEKLDGTNICDSGDIFFRKMRDRIGLLSDNTVGIEKEVNNSNIHRGTYNIYLMCELDAYDEIMQYVNNEVNNDEG